MTQSHLKIFSNIFPLIIYSHFSEIHFCIHFVFILTVAQQHYNFSCVVSLELCRSRIQDGVLSVRLLVASVCVQPSEINDDSNFQGWKKIKEVVLLANHAALTPRGKAIYRRSKTPLMTSITFTPARPRCTNWIVAHMHIFFLVTWFGLNSAPRFSPCDPVLVRTWRHFAMRQRFYNSEMLQWRRSVF